MLCTFSRISWPTQTMEVQISPVIVLVMLSTSLATIPHVSIKYYLVKYSQCTISLNMLSFVLPEVGHCYHPNLVAPHMAGGGLQTGLFSPQSYYQVGPLSCDVTSQ